MSDQLKYIIGELNKEPFNKGYNLITFDSLGSIQLLQVLTDVLAEVDPKQKIDVREEAADETAIRIISALKILKYRPTTDPAQLPASIVQGEKHVIQPIIEWLLRNMPKLKERAYLANYLVRINVPADFLADSKVSELNEEYEGRIKTFMEIHKEFTSTKESGFSTADIKKDIASMEDEKEQLIKRTERLKRKVESSPNSGPMLAVARNLRVERDREDQLKKQKQEQRNLLTQLENRIQRLQVQIKEAVQASIGTTPSGLLQRLEEETRVNKYMVKDKLPNEVNALKKSVQQLTKIVAEPAMGQSDLDVITQKIRETNSEINKLMEKRMLSSESSDKLAGLGALRQQASINRRKKEEAAESLHQAREELQAAEAERDSKQEKLKQTGGEVVKGDEFNKYVYKMRSKRTVYSDKHRQMAELRAEAGVLARTEDILAQKYDNINRQLSSVEAQRGVSGYRNTQDALENVSAMKSEFDTMKGRTLEDMSQMVEKLTKKIEVKKAALAPMLKELRPMRQQFQEMSQIYNEKKSSYDSLSAGFETNRSKLEQEVHGYVEELMALEHRFHYLNALMQILDGQLQRTEDEMKLYISSDQNDKKRSFREQYTKKIQEQENLGKGLRDKQKSIRENQDVNVKQVKMWRDVERLLKVKLRLAQCNSGQSADGDESVRPSGKHGRMGDSSITEDRLVL